MNDQTESHTQQPVATFRYWLAAGWAVIVVIAYVLRQISLHASIIQSLLDIIR